MGGLFENKEENMDFSTCVLGIELGSTRIKGVLIDESNQVIASGAYGWEMEVDYLNVWQK